MLLLSVVQDSSKKKGLSPAPCLTEIKYVESVSFVSPCLSVPPVLSVPMLQKIHLWGQVAKVVGNMTQPGFKSSGGLHLAGRVQPTIQDEDPIDKFTSDNRYVNTLKTAT